MKVSFWFDPACPFCWMTSRWVNAVASARDLEIDWQPISLFFKNDPDPDSGFYEPTKRTRDLLRVVESVRAAGHTDRIGELYTEMGRRIHHEEQLDFDVATILDELGLDRDHAEALDDERFDAAIRAAMDEGLGLTGEDVGTPLIGFEGGDGRRVGLFGPVITTFPRGDQALKLWDGVVAMAETEGFYELKRSRDTGPELPPDDTI